MIFELLKRSMIGIALSGIFTFIVLTIIIIQSMDIPIFDIWLNILASMVVGIYFGNASLLFEIEKWSMLKQTTVHAILSLMVFFPVAIMIGWIPFKPVEVIIGLVIFILTYVMFWLGIRWYLKRLEASMNDAIRK